MCFCKRYYDNFFTTHLRMRENQMKKDHKKDFTYSRVRRTPYVDMKENYYHLYHEIYYFLGGHRKFFIHDKEYTVQKGDLLVIPKGEIHKSTYISSNEDHERIAITFEDSYIEYLLREMGEKGIGIYHVSVPFEQRDFVERIFAKMADEYILKDDYSKMLISQNITELLIYIFRQTEMRDSGNGSEMTDQSMIEAAQYILEHYVEEISLEDMAERFQMSTSYFSRKFKSVTGFGFKEYVNALRLKNARMLLKGTNLSIMEISEQCGYENSNYFGDVFKKMEGISPREYRKNCGVK